MPPCVVFGVCRSRVFLHFHLTNRHIYSQYGKFSYSVIVADQSKGVGVKGTIMRTHETEEGPVQGGEMLTVQQVADYLQAHPETVRRWLREGRLHGLNFGGKGGWRIRRDELERFIQEWQGEQ